MSGIAFANVAIDGYAAAPTEDMRFNYETIGPRYFQTMRIPMVNGRDIDERDRDGSQRVVVVNETMARRYWPRGDALGGRLRIGIGEWLTIVGIAKDVKNRNLSETPQPFFYLPRFQDYRSNMILAARTALKPERMIRAVEGEVAALDPAIPMFDPKSMDEHIGVSLYRQRMAATLPSLFGLLALSLSAVGVYGVMAYTVSRRTRELGIRIAVGATHRDVVRLVLRQALTLSAIGIIGGLFVALLVTRFLRNLLYGVRPVDPRPSSRFQYCCWRRLGRRLPSRAPGAQNRPVEGTQGRLTLDSGVRSRVDTGLWSDPCRAAAVVNNRTRHRKAAAALAADRRGSPLIVRP